MLVLVFLMAIQRWQSEVYWAHVPDPPMLHPTIWESKEIMVTVHDMRLLDYPEAAGLQIPASYSYFGSGKVIPVCFAKSNSVLDCLVFPQNLLGPGQQ